MSLRAGIVVTGTEVLTGRVSDKNGPWLSERLTELGVEHAYTLVVADRPQDVEDALRFFAEQGCGLVLTSGGLGPTEDDLTAEVVSRFQQRPMALDDALEGRIWAVLESVRARWPNIDEEAIRAANRKQAMVPDGATVLEPIGTAPGLVVPPPEGSDGPTVVVLPGPPRELQPMWSRAVEAGALTSVLGAATEYELRMLRLFGIPESEIAETLRAARDGGVDIDALEITTCLRRGEVEVVTRFEPSTQADLYAAFEQVVRDRHADTLFSDDGSFVDDQVAEALLGAGETIATAESCTGGLVAARLTDRAGSSAYVRGGVVAYSNEAKVHLVGVDPALIEAHGAVSEEVAAALAAGAIERFGADVGIGITGIAGPDGGSAEKPVGLVWFGIAHRDGRATTRSLVIPGGRFDVRDRSTTVAMHLVRRLLLGTGGIAGR
ncbi:MAG: competence/damage-inducible protein A [Solirubrobacteraceae bacterium]|nr:competence/damage-inducible protein A [Solirubrobacteraceae bacterium]